jgi:hypothetical protein
MFTPACTNSDPSRVLRVLRRIVLGLVAFGLAGSAAELFLLEHTEGFWQWVPLVLIGVSLLSQAALAFLPGRASVRVFQGAMLLLLAGGVAGLVLHFKGNMEFELEMYPGQAGMKLYWETLKGATPALAPGMLLLLGSLGLASTWGHPALAVPERTLEQPKENHEKTHSALD